MCDEADKASNSALMRKNRSVLLDHPHLSAARISSHHLAPSFPDRAHAQLECDFWEIAVAN